MRTRLHSWLRGVVAGCVVLAAVPEAASAQAKVNPDPHEAPELKKLVLRGVQHVDIVDLERSISTQASSCRSLVVALFCLVSHSTNWVDRQYLDRGELARDIVRIRVYYWWRGFRSAEVDTIVTPNGPHEVTVTFDITEHEPTLLRRLTIDYDSAVFAEKRIKKLTMLKAGEPLDLVKLDSMRVLFANEMWASGHSDATVDTTVTVDKARRLADVHLTLIPNHATFVGPIEVVGLDKVSRTTVLNAITLRTGDKYRQGDVLESQRNLFESNLFRLAAVEVPPQFDSVKKIAITVSESPLHDAHTAVGPDEHRLSPGRRDVHRLQPARRRAAPRRQHDRRQHPRDAARRTRVLLQPRQRHSGRGLAESSFSRRGRRAWIFASRRFSTGRRTRPGFSAFAHRRSTPGIFIDRGYGGAVTVTNQVRIRAPASLTYRFEVNRVDASDVYFCINFGVCDTTTIGGLRSHQRLSPLSLTGFIDRSDDPLDPTRGYLARVDLEHASSATLSDYAYNRAYVDVAAYDHRGLTSTYAAHLRLGMVRSIGGSVLHPRKELYAGGASSVRGYGTNQLGPRVLTIDPNKLTDTLRAGHCTRRPWRTARAT